MKQLTDIEIQKAAILNAYRTAIRLKYRLMADAEIYKTLPSVEEKINRALAEGQPLELSPGEVFDAV